MGYQVMQASIAARPFLILRQEEMSVLNLTPPPLAPHPLSVIACLAGRDAEWLAQLAAKGRSVSYGPGDIMSGPGAGEASVAFVLRGLVRVSLPADRHGDVTFFDVAAGGLFGHLDALAGMAPTLSAVAHAQTDIHILPAPVFISVLESDPAIALLLLKETATDLVVRTPRPPASPDATLSGAELFSELLRMAEPDPDNDGHLLISRLPRHREMAGWSDLTEQDVAAGLAALVKCGCAERQYPGLRILDPDKLRALASGLPV
jgi:CRP-like cAMP-binding protein